MPYKKRRQRDTHTVYGLYKFSGAFSLTKQLIVKDEKMPVYEYRCNDCNIPFELRQKFSDPPADKCPQCGGTVRKLVSAASFSLKGAGWYGDGYGAKAEPAKPEGDTPAGTGDGDRAADAGAATEGVSPNAAPASTETTASPITQVETKSAAAVAPTPTKDKAEAKSSTSDVIA
jgi:putative FmdB family regulatory protein